MFWGYSLQAITPDVLGEMAGAAAVGPKEYAWIDTEDETWQKLDIKQRRGDGEVQATWNGKVWGAGCWWGAGGWCGAGRVGKRGWWALTHRVLWVHALRHKHLCPRGGTGLTEKPKLHVVGHGVPEGPAQQGLWWGARLGVPVVLMHPPTPTPLSHMLHPDPQVCAAHACALPRCPLSRSLIVF